ncbi:hypothetical protein E4U31_005727 [Claviceps sp. LM219 group G6]|nr:hypothetical protein E4U31_005727 [Claviceps sp. LM219 group G6]
MSDDMASGNRRQDPRVTSLEMLLSVCTLYCVKHITSGRRQDEDGATWDGTDLRRPAGGYAHLGIRDLYRDEQILAASKPC